MWVNSEVDQHPRSVPPEMTTVLTIMKLGDSLKGNIRLIGAFISFSIFPVLTFILNSILGSQIERAANGDVTIRNHKGYLRSMPDDDVRNGRQYLANGWRGPGTRFTGVAGTGLRRMRDENEPFAGRQVLRSTALGKIFL